MLDEYLEFLKGRIESDLASFADPGGVSMERNGRRFDAIWEVRGEPKEAMFKVSQDRGITVTANGQTEPYRTFLAGTRMADLRHMAQMIRHVGTQDVFVPTRAQLTDSEASLRPATDLLSDLLEHHETEVTQVVIVTGEAGAGKTRVLQELVQRQAAAYLKGLTGKLLLYVNAQGRALARLNEALATELQDLKVNLTYHSVTALARVGLLVPVIDGFGRASRHQRIRRRIQFASDVSGATRRRRPARRIGPIRVLRGRVPEPRQPRVHDRRTGMVSRSGQDRSLGRWRSEGISGRTGPPRVASG